MEAPPQGKSRVPPIATTPPTHPGLKEELLSQSSSGTQISCTSGVSLGEAIRRRSLINEEMEAWYLPCAETDNSNLIVTVGWRLGQKQGVCDRTEFPTMEEGLITPTENSRRQQASGTTYSSLLEIQDSQLSPNLPLLTTQGQTFFRESLFQQTGLDFAPLRTTPDLSGTASKEPSQSLQRSDTRQLATEVGPEFFSDRVSLSQHPLTFSIMAPNNANLGSYLPQYPLSFSEQTYLQQRSCGDWQMPRFDINAETLDSGILSSPMLQNQQLGVQYPPKECWRTESGQDLFLLNRSLPAPILQLLEEKVGLSKHHGFLSSENSSCKNVLGKAPEEDVISQPVAITNLSESRMPELLVGRHQHRGKTAPELESSKQLSDAAGKPFRNASGPEHLSANLLPVWMASRGPLIGLGDSCTTTEVSPASLPRQQHLPQASEAVSQADVNFHAPVPPQPIPVAAVLTEETNTKAETQSSASKNALTPSDWSIEKEYRGTEISPSFNEGSFLVHLAHPIHHSTPGIFAARILNHESPVMIPPAKPILQSPLSCLGEESSKTSYASTCIPSVQEPHVPLAEDSCPLPTKESLMFQGGKDFKSENSSRPAFLQPLKGRIQSLPSLNFMEKVGAWNMSHSAEKMSEALALHGSDGISPRPKAYSAVGDSLNCPLLKQQSLMDPKAGLASSFCGPNSSFHNKKSPCALPFTRSQSENSVVAVSREISRTEVGKETWQKDSVPQAEGNGSVSGASDVTGDLLSRQYKAFVVSAVSSDEETIGNVAKGKHSDHLIRSERVAELLREEDSSLRGSPEESEGSGENGKELPGFSLSTVQDEMGHFRDISPDKLNQITHSRTGSPAGLRPVSRQSSRSSIVSGKLQSSLVDELRTPDDREINIEERIPVYLHNLGIDQSPSSILTPFMPRGPIRETELSPTELRTLKASTDLLTQHLQFSEGGSQSVKDAMQSTLDSSVLSGPALARSKVVPDNSLPLQISPQAFPQPSRDLLPQSNCPGRSHAVTPLLAEASFAPISTEVTNQVISAVSSNFAEERASKCVAMPEDNLGSDKHGVIQAKPSSLSQEKDGKHGSEDIRSSNVISEREKDDTFLGSYTLKESQELPAKVENKTLSGEFRSASSISSSTLKPNSKVGESGGPSSVNRSGLEGSKIWSWDEFVTKQNSSSCLKWEELQAVNSSFKGLHGTPKSSSSKEQIVTEKLRLESQVFKEGQKMRSRVTRSEPEGCNSAAVNQNLPVFMSGGAESLVCALQNGKEVQPPSGMEPLESRPNLLENSLQVERSSEANNKESGSTCRSAASSSVDSLGLQVRRLLQGDLSVRPEAPWMERKESDGSGQKQHWEAANLAFSRADTGTQANENNSSLDSLAVRVKTLLDEEQPVMHATEILRSVEEETARVQAWVKLKLETQPQLFIPDLNEEDRRIIEQIKKEQLPCSRKTEHIKDQQWGNSYKRISNCSPVSTLESGFSSNLRGTEFQEVPNYPLVEFPKENSVQASSVCGTDGALSHEPDLKPLNIVQSYVSNCPQTHIVHSLDSKDNVHVPLRKDMETHLVGLKGASKAHETITSAQTDQTESSCGVEATKQITSITFASRRRSPSPASRVPGQADPCDPLPLETTQVNHEQLMQESHKACALADLASPLIPENIRSSSQRDYHQPSSIMVSMHESHQENAAASIEKTPNNGVAPKILASTKSSEEKHLILTEMRSHGNPADDVYHNKSNGGRMMVDPLLSVSGPPPKTFEFSADDIERFDHTSKPPFLESKENMLTEDNKYISDSCLRKAGEYNESTRCRSSLGHLSTDRPISPSSPARKALSGVHITLSSKRIDLDLPSLLDIATEKREVDGFKTDVQPATSDAPNLLLEAESKLKATELNSKTQESSYIAKEAFQSVPQVAQSAMHQGQESLDGRQNLPVVTQANMNVLSSCGPSLGDNIKTTVSSQTERMSSDAITQITTESPEKTTYSAEIFLTSENSEVNALRPSHQESHDIPSNTSPAITMNSKKRQADQPLLLPYKPPGCSEVYYVPCPKETLPLSRVRSETTMESSHSGSNDAIPPNFPPQALGSRDDNCLDAAIVKHKEGIYSKNAAPKAAWMEEKMAMQDGFRESARAKRSLESLRAAHSTFGSAQFYPHHPAPLQHEPHFLPGSKDLGQHAGFRFTAPSEDLFQHKRAIGRGLLPLSLPQGKREGVFTRLNAEVDYSFLEELKTGEALEEDLTKRKVAQLEEVKSDREIASELPLSGSQPVHLKEKQAAEPLQVHSLPLISSLDELWTKYLERQQQKQELNSGSSCRTEVSLVDRLDRLARLLQNPVRYFLMPALEEQSNKQKEPAVANPRGRKIGFGKNLAFHSNTRMVEETLDATGNAWWSKSTFRKTGNAPAVDRVDRNFEQHQNIEALSDSSSEMRPVRESSVLTDITSESEATQPETESATQTEGSGSVSTINTARLIRAFGHERVEVSPKLSQLYKAINVQKTHSENWAKRSKKTRGSDYPTFVHAEQKRKEIKAMDSCKSSDSLSSISSSHGPSPALTSKRMLNKAVQAGDIEIVSSATKRHTRDVGLTFPTPSSSQVRLLGGARNAAEEPSTPQDGLLARNKEQSKRQPSSLLAEKKPRRHQSRWMPGVSWFLPAADLNAERREDKVASFVSVPGPSWFEPLPQRKQWREPLREKNGPEPHKIFQARLAAPARDVENKPPSPLGRMTLQECLARHRPDFISSSGERMKRLKLIMEERKLQSMFQGEREDLFNPPEVRSNRNASGLSNRDYRTVQRRAISKNEMVERSKRIYEQLPEVRKRREEEKRRCDYSTNRLKAQLYKTKITNRVLGRKVPWE